MTAGRLIRKKTFVLAALAAIGAIVLTAFLVQQAGPRSATAADHLDAPGPAPPPGGDGIGTDLTDVYAFQSPAHSANTVLIMNVNGLASTAGIGNGPGDDRAFAQAIPKVKVDVPVYYYFRVANGDDPVADVNIQVAFGKVAKDGSQDMRVKVLGTGKEIELEGSSTGFGKARS